VEHAVALARQQASSVSIRIELQKDPRLPNVEHDSGQIYQVVLNLLLNAMQAIDGAGTIRVEISLVDGDAAITVVDTGRGIAPEHLANIFRPFYTTKGNGTGLGLSMAHRTVEDHHGRIEVTSEIGKGARFLVVLPLLQLSAWGKRPESSLSFNHSNGTLLLQSWRTHTVAPPIRLRAHYLFRSNRRRSRPAEAP
jgi:two-component system, NtrC family, sensor histidine kinase HydH